MWQQKNAHVSNALPAAGGGAISLQGGSATAGKTLFAQKCTACHKVAPFNQVLVGPGLAGVLHDPSHPNLVNGQPATPENVAAILQNGYTGSMGTMPNATANGLSAVRHCELGRIPGDAQVRESKKYDSSSGYTPAGSPVTSIPSRKVSSGDTFFRSITRSSGFSTSSPPSFSSCSPACWRRRFARSFSTPTAASSAPDTYNEIYSVHGSAMVWLVIIPLLTGGFGNLVFPLQIGARDVAFPWLNMLSFWIFPVSGLMLFSSFLMGAPTAGWMEYPPVSLQGAAGTSMWAAAIFLVGVSSTMTGINFVVTILKMRAPGMTFTRMPLFVWGQFATAPLLMIATTALAAALAALFIERQFGVPFYDPTKGGSPVMWQHMFWFYSHPAVYIMVLPAFGIISEVLADLRAQADLRL